MILGVILFMFFMSMFIFVNYYKYLLMNLLGMEFMVISFLMLFYYLLMLNNNEYIFLYFLVILISHSVLGLSLLVNLVRMFGNDNSINLNLIMW